ncbi:IS3 family transposase [Paenochrobactrum glaciei]|uniref:IS3 family transposase n=1 Tax=Paenochrobactrum glaciei TaxID=486407 RepID=UPI0035BC0509
MFERRVLHYGSNALYAPNKHKRGEQTALNLRIKEICRAHVRYGYRRVHVLLWRESWEINMKRTRSLYNELGLQLLNYPRSVR